MVYDLSRSVLSKPVISAEIAELEKKVLAVFPSLDVPLPPLRGLSTIRPNRSLNFCCTNFFLCKKSFMFI